ATPLPPRRQAQPRPPARTKPTENHGRKEPVGARPGESAPWHAAGRDVVLQVPCSSDSPQCAIRLTHEAGGTRRTHETGVMAADGPLLRVVHVPSPQHYSRSHIIRVNAWLDVCGLEQVDRLCDLLDAPVPPFDSQKGFDLLGRESETGNPGWISSHDRIRRHILALHTSGTDHHPVTQGDA